MSDPVLPRRADACTATARGRRLRRRGLRLRPPPGPVRLDGAHAGDAPHRGRARRRRRPQHHRGRPRGPRGAAPLRRDPRAGLPVGRLPPLPGLRAHRPDRGVDPGRPGRVGAAPSTPVRGWRAAGRCGPRTRRCAGWPTWPGCPPEAGGCFVAGGTMGNLSALVAARATPGRPGRPGRRPGPTGGPSSRGLAAHSSVQASAGVMDADAGRRARRAAHRRRPRPGPGRGRRPGLRRGGHRRDDQPGPGRRPGRRSPTPVPQAGVWLHVDGAYGAGRPGRARRPGHRFAGIERADSFIVDPHKWLFAPFDACALLYRDPAGAKAAHAQHAGLPRRPQRERRLEPVRLRRPPDPPGAGPAVLVLAGRPRHAGLRRGRRALPGHRPGRRRPGPRRRPTSSWSSSRSCRSWPSAASGGPRPTTSPGPAACWIRDWRSSSPPPTPASTILRLCIVNPRTTVDDVAPRPRLAGLTGPRLQTLCRRPSASRPCPRGRLFSRDEAHIRDGRGGQLTGQGPHRFVVGSTAQEPGPAGHPPEARPLHQRRSRHHEPVAARRGVRHRGRG